MPKQNPVVETDTPEDEYEYALDVTGAPTEEKKTRANNNPMMFRFVPETLDNPEPVYEALTSIQRRMMCSTEDLINVLVGYPQWQANEGQRRMEKEKESLLLKLQQMGLKVTVE
jgi:hypothetical protein